MTSTISRRGPRTRASALYLLLIAGLTASTSPAAGQEGEYLNQVRTLMAEAHALLAAEGYEFVGESQGWMAAGERAASVWTLPAGDWVAVAVCDVDCTDIDLSAQSGVDGSVLGSDEDLDSNPLVEFALAQATEVAITAALVDCETLRCFVGVRWYARAGDTAPTTGWEDQVTAQFDGAGDLAGHTRSLERTGLVDAGSTASFTLKLTPGQYGALAVCDNDCTDIDLALFDAAGNELASDVLEDDIPVLDFTIPSVGTYEVRVLMASCATSSCGYGFRLYTRDR